MEVSIQLILLIPYLLFFGMTNAQRRASYGQPCNRLTRCDSRASLTCKSGVCECINPETMTYDSVYGRCSVLAGERCIFTTVETDNRAEGRTWKEELPCVPSALCQEGFCSCFSGFYETSNGTCLPKKDHREDCESVSACRDDKFLVCENQVCDCNSTIASYDFPRQMCVRRPGALCGDFGVCVNNAYCRNPENSLHSVDSLNPMAGAICECEEGFFANSQGACERKRTFGEECNDDSNCQSEDYTRLTCTADGRCGCNSSISYFDVNSNMCRRLAGANCGDFPYCIENSECGRLREFYLLDTSEPTCDCGNGFFATKNGTCELQYRFGESCEANNNCKKGLLCDEQKKICQCDLSKSVYDRVKGRCVGLANSPCDNTDNCITNSECLWGITDESRRQCLCKPGYAHSTNGSCLASYDVWCSDDWTYACNHEQGLVCNEGKCACKFSEFQTFDTELRMCVSQINGPCNDSIPCVSNSHCSTAGEHRVPRCQCNQGFVQVDGECQLTIGQPCNYSIDANSNLFPKCDSLATLFCIEGTCQCPPLQVYDPNLLKCRGLVGSACQITRLDDKVSEDFCVPGAVCVKRRFHDKTSGICKCQRGWSTTKERKCLNILTEEHVINLLNSTSFSSV